ncbi:hypothetical protein OG339_48580 (plasmid) [Streptosporangium sp. NBC_01495]|uniref:hypothetical protein n=1 Tax=Streptosporangium sp. NBC_01495 TaxID=2903899 RepID=UPI002E36011F|nr:hypothetical protein [Streptosporangium sp. NBC_01495]
MKRIKLALRTNPVRSLVATSSALLSVSEILFDDLEVGLAGLACALWLAMTTTAKLELGLKQAGKEPADTAARTDEEQGRV